MRQSIFQLILGLIAASLLFATRYLDFVQGVPMVGSVRLGGEGSGLSWAGDTRIYISILLILVATVTKMLTGRLGTTLPSWISGASIGWLVAFVFGALDWYAQQRAMLLAMGINPAEIEIRPGGGAYCFLLGLLIWGAANCVRQKPSKY